MSDMLKNEDLWGEYTSVIKCLNKDVISAIDIILTNDPQAVIIIQGDHGLSYHDSAGVNWSEIEFDAWTDDIYRHRYGILNLVRVPEACRAQLYESFTPVNTFRFVFACLTGQQPDLVDDFSYKASYYSDVVEAWYE